ncbi:MAG: YdcH family protein [Polyangiaceae bacterium]|nr:YdcH family protein [Polyangiaceae bacterium]
MKQLISSSRPLSLHNVEERLNLIQARHRELDARLRELGKHAFLTPAEQLEASQLKKHKLRAKDEIEALRRARS